MHGRESAVRGCGRLVRRSLSRWSSLSAVIREFVSRFPRLVLLLVTVLMIEGLVSIAAVLAIVPLADFLLDLCWRQ